jgi:hypothetical protein
MGCFSAPVTRGREYGATAEVTGEAGATFAAVGGRGIFSEKQTWYAAASEAGRTITLTGRYLALPGKAPLTSRFGITVRRR